MLHCVEAEKHRQGCRLDAQVALNAEEKRDGAARQAIIAVTCLQAIAGGGKAHASAAAVPGAARILHARVVLDQSVVSTEPERSLQTVSTAASDTLFATQGVGLSSCLAGLYQTGS